MCNSRLITRGSLGLIVLPKATLLIDHYEKTYNLSVTSLIGYTNLKYWLL